MEIYTPELLEAMKQDSIRLREKEIQILAHCKRECDGCSYNLEWLNGDKNCRLILRHKHFPKQNPGVKEISVEDAAKVVLAFCECRYNNCDGCPLSEETDGFIHCSVENHPHRFFQTSGGNNV